MAAFSMTGNGFSTVTDVVSPSRELEAFLAAPTYTRDEVLSKPCPIPLSPGVYGWWFRSFPAGLVAGDCFARDGLTLLYTGISPKEPPKNGAQPSRQTLRKRLISQHYAGNAAGSTLRLSLGCLLSEELGIELRRYGSGKRRHFGEGEQFLSGWMRDNVLVSWVVHPQPWILERQLIEELDLPINCDGNSRNAFHATLTAARKEAARRAEELPILPNPGVGGAKAAYRHGRSL